ncbi:unnamed protein product, partial [Meganyctiphanes norvegica]
MARLDIFRRNRLRRRSNFLRKTISTTFIFIIIYSLSSSTYEDHVSPFYFHIQLNDLEPKTTSQTLKSNPEPIQYNTKQTNPNEQLLDIQFTSDLTDKICNKEFRQIFNVNMINETWTKFQQLASCGQILVTNHLPSYVSKEAGHNQINNSILKCDSIYSNLMKQYIIISKLMKISCHYEENICQNIDNKASNIFTFSKDFEADFYNRILNGNYCQSPVNSINMNEFNCPSAYHDIFKVEMVHHNQRTRRSKYVANRIVQPNASEKHPTERIKSIFINVFNTINLILKPEGNNGKIFQQSDLEIIKVYGSYTVNSKLYPINENYATSPGSANEPSKLAMLILIVAMMAGVVAPSSAVPPTVSLVTEKDLNKFQVIHVLNTVAQPVLLEVYQLYKRFDNSKSIKDHLIQDCHMSVHSYREKFDATMRNVIETTDNSGKEYDISLLVKCLRVLSWQYDPHGQNKWRDDDELERRSQKLVDKRNQTYHTFLGISIPEMRKEIDDIQKLLMDILTSLEVRYPSESRKINDLKTESLNNMNYIRTHPLGNSDIKTYLLQKSMKLLRNEIPSYKTKCEEWGKLKILEFLLGSSTFHDIRLLFTETIVEKSNKLSKNTPVNCKNILTFASRFTILLIESEAGGGKTTVFRYVINDWGKGGTIMSSTDYDFIFPMLFRDPLTSSVKDLICALVPNISTNMDTEYIMKCIEDPSQKILFFCDGYDEKNINSLQLFNEICLLKEKYPHIRVIVTSRPESVKEFYLSLSSTTHSIEHLKILGIHQNKRGDFLKKYHEELIAAGLSTQSSDDLLHFYKSCSDRHKDLYRLPINLVILAWIWGQDPKAAETIKSAAGLYAAIMNIFNKKLIERILNSYPDVKVKLHGDINKLIDQIDSFKEKVYSESLAANRFDRLYIDNDGVRNLREFCDELELPFSELKGAYLLSKLEWENICDLKEILEVPHKGFLDYYTAKCIESKLLQMEKESKLSDRSERSWLNKLMPWRRINPIKKIISDTYGKDYKKEYLSKYQNIVQLLGSILALKDGNLIDKYGKDIIDILIDTGVSNNSQWYDTYMDLNSNPTAAEKFGNLIGPKLNLNGFTIKDGDIEVLSTLLQYVDIKKATVDISGTDMPAQLPDLIDILRKKQCKVLIKHLPVKDADVEVMSTLLQYVQIDKATLDISSSAMPPQLPVLVDVLTDKQCEIAIKEITDDNIETWNDILTQNDKVNIKNVTLNMIKTDMPPQLPSLIKVLSDKQCKVSITKINNDPIQLWKSVLTIDNTINLTDVTLDISGTALPNQPLTLIHVLRHNKCQITIPEITDALVPSLNSGNAPFA